MRRNALTSVITLVALAAIGLASTFVWSKRPTLGLDLQGGASVVLRPTEKPQPGALNVSKSIIRSRVDGLGVAEPEITLQGDAIVVALPGVKDQNKALDLVGKTAELRFRPVLQVLPADQTSPIPDFTQITAATTVPAAGATATTVGANDSVTTTAGATTAGATSATGTTLPATGAAGNAALPRQAASTTAAGTTATTAAGTTATAAGTTATTAAGTTATTATPIPTTVLANTPAADDNPADEVILPDRGGQVRYRLGPAFLTGAGVSTASSEFTTEWGVKLELKGGKDGIDAFNTVAAECYAGASASCPGTGSRRGAIAIVLDSVVQSAPAINAPTFTADQISITGNFKKKDADDLSLILRYGALPVKLQAEAVQTVSATLGKDSLRAGLIAGLVGVGLVLLFMLLYYRSLAVVVIAGLVLSAAILWSLVSWVGATLTLSGATGIIVSIGVTVDSYVVFFERLKDDLHAGKTLRSSAGRGFASAWRTIVAADVVSLIGAAVLYWFTVGSVRGFALFLGLSTLIDLLVAYFFTRPAVRILSQSGRFRGANALGIHVGDAVPVGSAS